jgi:LuxR family maltose regulon positive regulatory protein
VLASTGSAALLERIEASNLFLLPLDSRRLWYRYHHLFAELLRLELRRTDAAAIPELHRRASAWHRAQGLVSEAIRHAIAGGDLDVAAELIAEHWNPALCEGRLATVAGWLDALPADAVARDPRLCIVRAWLALNLGELDAMEGWVQAAEQGTLPGPFRDGMSSVASAAALLRACLCQRVGDATGSVAAAREAVAMERDSRTSWCTVAHAALGVALYWAGEGDEADAALTEALRMAAPPDDNLSYLHALGCLAALRLEGGDTAAAETLLADGEALADRYGLTEYWVTSMMVVVRGRLLAEQGDVERARDVLEHALRLARRGSGLLENAHTLLSLAVVAERLGLSERAAELLAQGRRRAAEAPDSARLAALVAATEKAVRGGDRAAPAAATDEPLTEREAAVLRLLATDLSLREIGAELFVSLNTVKTHARAIYRKLDVTTRADAVARAREAGLR